MSGVVSRWLGGVDALDDIANRLLRVQIENRPAIDVIRLYDDDKTLFYCDPPYMHETRGDKKAYGFEMNSQQHWELAETLQQCKGLVAISGYRCGEMDKWYKGWKRFDAPEKTIHSTNQLRQECLCTNYEFVPLHPAHPGKRKQHYFVLFTKTLSKVWSHFSLLSRKTAGSINFIGTFF